MPPYGDLLVCGVSSQLKQEVPGFDDRIRKSDADFADSGVIVESLIRMGFLAVLPRRKIIGAIGTISPERHRRPLQTLADFLTG
jgi:mRNA interferase MazF